MSVPRTSWFTLIELLVVVSIIAILAAMLLPALSTARARVITTDCGSTQKQWAGLVFLFAEDHDEYLPPVNYSTKAPGCDGKPFPDYPSEFAATPINYPWPCRQPANTFFPYFQPLQKLLCRAHPSESMYRSYINSGGDSWQTSNTYTLAGGHLSQWSVSSRVKNKVGRAVYPSELFLILEREDYPTQDSNAFRDSSFQLNWGTYQYMTMGYHHNSFRGYNATFFDQHVEFRKLDHPPISEFDAGTVPANWR